MVDGGGVPISVVYLDGDTESSLGEFTVDASFNFNNFLSFLSHRIGISPHNFSVYLSTFGSNRKIPITAKVNVAAIAGADSTSSFFLVKRSRRPRRNKPRNRGSRNNANANNDNNNARPENVVLVRRNDAVSALGRGEYEKRVRELQMERERFMMKITTGGGVFCEECLVGTDGGFHWCVYDAVVTNGFRSPAGPVARPVKGFE